MSDQRAALAPGTRVRVGHVDPDTYKRPPEYAEDATGTVAAIRGQFVPPEHDAAEPLVSVRFAAADLWHDADDDNQTVQVDIWADCLTEVSR